MSNVYLKWREKLGSAQLENVTQHGYWAAAERNELRRFALKLVDEGKLTDVDYEDLEEAIQSDAYARVLKLTWIKKRRENQGK